MSSNPSRGPSDLKAAVFVGQGDCVHQEFMQSVDVEFGTGRDEGTVTFFIGSGAVTFNCRAALLALLDQRKATNAVAIAG